MFTNKTATTINANIKNKSEKMFYWFGCLHFVSFSSDLDREIKIKCETTENKRMDEGPEDNTQVSIMYWHMCK